MSRRQLAIFQGTGPPACAWSESHPGSRFFYEWLVPLRVGDSPWELPSSVSGISVDSQYGDKGTNPKGSIMFERNAVVAVYDKHGGVEEAVRALQTSGFDMKRISIVGKDDHAEDQVAGYYSSGGRMRYWGERRAFWEAMWSMLSGWASFAIPGFGPVLVAGPLVGWILTVLDDLALVGGTSALGAALYSMGIPKDSVMTYETSVKGDSILLIAYGTADEVVRARDIIKRTRAVDSVVHAG